MLLQSNRKSKSSSKITCRRCGKISCTAQDPIQNPATTRSQIQARSTRHHRSEIHIHILHPIVFAPACNLSLISPRTQIYQINPPSSPSSISIHHGTDRHKSQQKIQKKKRPPPKSEGNTSTPDHEAPTTPRAPPAGRSPADQRGWWGAAPTRQTREPNLATIQTVRQQGDGDRGKLDSPGDGRAEAKRGRARSDLATVEAAVAKSGGARRLG